MLSRFRRSKPLFPNIVTPGLYASLTGKSGGHDHGKSEGSRLQNRTVDVVYLSRNPTISMLAANHQMPVKEMLLILLLFVVLVLIALDSLLRFAWWIGIRPQWIGSYVGWFNAHSHS